MGKASRKKRQAADEVDLLAVHRSGKCTHCRQRPPASPGALWCKSCAENALRHGQMRPTDAPRIITFDRTGRLWRRHGGGYRRHLFRGDRDVEYRFLYRLGEFIDSFNKEGSDAPRPDRPASPPDDGPGGDVAR